MKLNVINLAKAVAIATAIIWLVCSLLVGLAPSPMMMWSGYMFHADFSGHAFNMGFGGLIGGLLLWPLLLGSLAALSAYLYNRMAD